MTPYAGQRAGPLYARDELLRTLRALLGQGSTVLLHGPVGVGKSAILQALASWARASSRSGEGALRTVRFEDGAGPIVGVKTAAVTRHEVSSLVRRAFEAHSGVLLLDDVVEASAPLMGLVRAARGSGLGVVLAVDLERIPARGFGMVDREIAVPRLHSAVLRQIVAERLVGLALPNPLVEADRLALLVAAEGRPGKLIAMIERLTIPAYWHDGRLRLGPLEADTSTALSRPHQRGVPVSSDTGAW